MTEKINKQNWLTIIGIGEEGFDLLNEEAKHALNEAKLIIGNNRQLNLIPEKSTPHARRELWPSPMLPRLERLLIERLNNTVIIASGDPLCWGIGQTFAKHCSKPEMKIIPSLSIISRITAHMLWSTNEVSSLSLCSQPIERLNSLLKHDAKFILLSATSQSPKDIANYLTSKGYENSQITILEDLGSKKETITETTAKDLANSLQNISALNSLAIKLFQNETTQKPANTLPYTTEPGLPDQAFLNDGQLTKQNIRAITLAHLRPNPGELLWDIGSGSGSIAIEWLRTNLLKNQTPCRAIGIEKNPTRLARAKENAERLGVADLQLIEATAPKGLSELEAPDAIFIGGGVSEPNLLKTAIKALSLNGRLVANAVTIEGEASLIEAYKKYGGALNKIAISKADSIGRFKGWRPQMPITQWVFIKNEEIEFTE